MADALAPVPPEPGVYKLQNLLAGADGPLFVTLVDPKEETLTSWPAEPSKDAGQKWQVAHLGGGQYSIIGYTTGLSITTKNGANEEEPPGSNKQAKAELLPPSDRTARWTFDGLQDTGNYYIRNVENPDVVIDLAGSFTTSGNKILIWPKNTPSSNNQIWKLAPV